MQNAKGANHKVEKSLENVCKTHRGQIIKLNNDWKAYIKHTRGAFFSFYRVLRPRRGPGGEVTTALVNPNALRALSSSSVFLVFVASVQPLMEEIKATPNHNVGHPLFNAKEIITLAIRLSMQRGKRS